MTPEQFIYFGEYWNALHKNKVFIHYLKMSYIVFIERRYFG